MTQDEEKPDQNTKKSKKTVLMTKDDLNKSQAEKIEKAQIKKGKMMTDENEEKIKVGF